MSEGKAMHSTKYYDCIDMILIVRVLFEYKVISEYMDVSGARVHTAYSALRCSREEMC